MAAHDYVKKNKSELESAFLMADEIEKARQMRTAFKMAQELQLKMGGDGGGGGGKAKKTRFRARDKTRRGRGERYREGAIGGKPRHARRKAAAAAAAAAAAEVRGGTQ